MNIQTITLKNFKKFRDKTIQLNKGLTLLVGGNNEGKSSILHALAIWEFCKRFLLINRGAKALQQPHHSAGVGMNIDDFTPINIPELKYLWTNLKPSGGYNLSIKCEWEIGEIKKYLEIGLALANDRLFVKTLSSNVCNESELPSIAYLPPFAGILDKEIWRYPAQRQKLIGQGLAGSVLRNVIIDMHNNNKQKRVELKGNRSKIKSADLKKLRETDPYEVLNTVLYKTFQCQLVSREFNHNFHQYLHVDIVKGVKDNTKFKAFANYKPRDIMTEGSGFLQWLSVYTFALDPNVDVLLLDEPDAHLHCSLQTNLFLNLQNIINQNKRQILLATHSTEIIKAAPVDVVMDINKGNCKYISSPKDLIRIMSGLGSEYNPLIDSVVKTKRILFVENESDAVILKHFAEIAKIEWPTNLTVWPTASKHDYRNHVIDILKAQINGVAMISLVDRDSSDYNSVDDQLNDKSFSDKKEGDLIYARFRKWRRTEIENYLLNKSVLSRISGLTNAQVEEFFIKNGLVLPSSDDFKISEMQGNTRPFFDLSGKEYINNFCKGKHFDKFDIAKEFARDEICDDIIVLLNEIRQICN